MFHLKEVGLAGFSARQIAPAVLAAFLVMTSMATGDDWPQWQGVNRDAISAEKGLLKAWPEGGPKLLRTIEGIGQGYSSPSVARGKIFVTGNVDKDSMMFCFDLEGKRIWDPVRTGEATDGGGHPGARSSPTVDGETVYVLSETGQLGAYEVESGKEVWSFNILERYGGKSPNWKIAESALVDGDKVICTPGGPDASVVAVSKETGETIWTSKGLSESCSFSSAIAFNCGQYRVIAVMTTKAVVGVSAKDGTLLWRFERPANRQGWNCSTPLYSEGIVFAATGYGNGGGAAKIDSSQSTCTLTQVWETKDMKAHHGGYVLVDGYLYGNNDREGWSCLDFKTGQLMYKEEGVGKGSVCAADGMLYTLGEQGTMGLMEANPRESKLVSTFDIPNAGKKTWAHPVISDGRLYLRREDKVFVYDIRKDGN